jgi:hypothetical protein
MAVYNIHELASWNKAHDSLLYGFCRIYVLPTAEQGAIPEHIAGFTEL